MSIFGKIMSAIFGHAQAGGAPSASTTPSMASPATVPSAAAGASAGAKGSVDVSAVLTELAAHNQEKLDWRHSIVDLMKLLDLDSSLAARKELAKELQFSGNLSDSAAMNTWLHRQVMQKLAENGGKVPEELKV